MLFPVQRPGEDITAEWELFFFSLPIFLFLVKNFKISLQKIRGGTKEKKKNCGRATGHNFCHPLDRRQTFFLGWPDPSCDNYTYSSLGTS